MISKAQRRLTGQMLVQTEWTSFVDSFFVSNLSPRGHFMYNRLCHPVLQRNLVLDDSDCAKTA